MLARTLYESLPIGYLALGSSSLMVFEPIYAIISASVIFWLGAEVYNLRSHNRRTDPLRKRKPGLLPEFLYSFLPFLYLFLSLLIFRSHFSGVQNILALLLLTYGLYILVRRASYRRHKVPAVKNII